jgi:hypothetical protein
LSFHNDSDWTVEAEETSPAAARPLNNGVVAALGLAAGITIGALVTALVLRGSPSTVVYPQASAASEPTAAQQQGTATPLAPTASSALAADGLVPAPAASIGASPHAASTPDPLVHEAPKAGPTPLTAAEAQRKELAWARFYKRPVECEGNPSADQLIECANHFIRAKRDFDQRWRAGAI